MSNSINQYDLELKVKNYLLNNRIRLCDPPYVSTDGVSDDLNNLISDLTSSFQVEREYIVSVLDSLKEKSITYLVNKEKLESCNVHTIKIFVPKLKMNISLELTDFDNENGFSLMKKVSETLNLDVNLIKLIYSGKIIENEKSIKDQGFRNNCKVVVLVLNEHQALDANMIDDLNKSRNRAEYLSKRVKDGKFKNSEMSLEITNQSGHTLNVTEEEKSLLTYGLAMHQQASKYLAVGNYQIALLHCLDAEEALSRSNFSDKVDNMALLQLDIVWCYYSLENIDDLADANSRLDKCEACMLKTYGPHNERIKQIRYQETFEGIPEYCHMFRLYVMKAIVAYYFNQPDQTRQFLRQAKEVYDKVTVPVDLVNEVMLMGFSQKEALSGLQVSRDINEAVEYVIRKRNDKLKLKEAAQLREKRKAIARRLGYTKNKSRVNLDAVDSLIATSGSSSQLCLAAIRRADNDLAVARQLVLQEESRLYQDIELDRMAGLPVDGDLSYDCLLHEKETVAQLQPLLGNISPSTIMKCLRQNRGNTDQVLNILLSDETNALYHEESSEENFDQESDTNSEMEQEIYDNIGKGSAHNIEDRYINNDLMHELIAYNKFAAFIDMATIQC